MGASRLRAANARTASIFQDQAKVPRMDGQEIDPETEANSDSENDLEEWLGVRDGIRN
jgi:hypothetical protein